MSMGYSFSHILQNSNRFRDNLPKENWENYCYKNNHEEAHYDDECTSDKNKETNFLNHHLSFNILIGSVMIVQNKIGRDITTAKIT
jgi:hypothetical protein